MQAKFGVDNQTCADYDWFTSMCHKLDPVYFARLAALEPDETCRRSICTYEREKRSYLVPFLRWQYRIDPAHHTIEPVTPVGGEVSADLGLLLLFYLLHVKSTPFTGRWVSEFDLPGGSMFFRGPHRFRTDELAARYGRDIEGFTEACRQLGGAPIDLGDRAFRFHVLPRVPAAVVLWRADEEFEASAKLLMDESIREHLPLDVIFGMSLELLGALVGRPLWR